MRETLEEIGLRLLLQEIRDIEAFRKLMEGPYPCKVGSTIEIKIPERWNVKHG